MLLQNPVFPYDASVPKSKVVIKFFKEEKREVLE